MSIAVVTAVVIAAVPSARADADGLPDPSFGAGGLFLGSLPGVQENIESYVAQVIRDRSGRWIVLGQPQDGSNTNVIARYRSDGSLDTSFGSDGWFSQTASADGAHTLATEIDGSLIGVSQAGVQLFGSGIHPGRAISVPQSSTRSPVTVLPDGRLLIPHTTVTPAADGTLHEHAGAWIFDGPTSTAEPVELLPPPGATDASNVTAAVDAAGRIYLLGCFPSTVSTCAITAYHPDGALDTSYGSGGSAPLQLASAIGSCRFDVAPDGYAATVCPTGFTEAQVRVLDASGRPDNAFVPRTLALAPPSIGGTFDVKVDGAGRVLVGFAAPVTIAQSAPTLLALLPDGSNDPTFGVGGITELVGAGAFSGMAIDDQGGAYAWGRSSGHTSFWIASISEDAGTALQPPLEPTSRFVATAPERVLDTRRGLGAPPSGEPGAGATVRLVVAGRGSVPAAGVTAVALNVTATEAAGPGYVTVWPTGLVRPIASNLNLTAAGETNANMIVVPLGADGGVSLYTQGGTHLLADLAGYFVAADHATAGRFVSAPAPVRLLDTRTGTGAPATKPGAGAQVDLHVLGAGPVPAAGVSAVVLNLTGTEASADGFVTAWPTGLGRPTASSLNLSTGATRANLVVVPIGTGGDISLFTQSGTHLVADVEGWFTDGSAPDVDAGLFVSVPPRRMLDTRILPGRLLRDTAIARSIGGTRIVPAGANAVIANITATNSVAAGFVTAMPAGVTSPIASTLNLPGKDATVPNAAVIGLGDDDAIARYTQSGTDLVVDVNGWFT